MTDENEKKHLLTAFMCPPSKCTCECAAGGPCEHVWDGPECEFDEGRGSSATCSRCGMPAIEHSLWCLP